MIAEMLLNGSRKNVKKTIAIRHILDPLWSKPVIIVQGAKLLVFINTFFTDTKFFAVLINLNGVFYSLGIENVLKKDDTLYEIECRIPPRMPNRVLFSFS